MGLREWLIVGGVALVALILFDGWRRISSRQGKIRMDIDPNVEGSAGEADHYNPELPNGGARKKTASDSVNHEVAAQEPSLVQEAVAELQANIDREASMISGLRAERDAQPEFDTVMDDGALVSKPRPVATPESETVHRSSEPKVKPEPVSDAPLSRAESVPSSESPLEAADPDSASQLSDWVPEDDSRESETALAEQDEQLLRELESRPEAFESLEEPPAAQLDKTDQPAPTQKAEAKRPQPSKVTGEPGALGEVEDLFELADFDFDRPIHELMDASADDTLETARKSSVSKRPAHTDKAPADDTPFDRLLEQADENDALEDIDSLVPDLAEEVAAELKSKAISTESEHPVRRDDETGRQHRDLDLSDPELSLVILVVAKKGQRLPGASIKSIVEACGMEFGQLSLFHRYEDESARSPIQFSMSDAVQPGSFDLSTLNDYETPAVSFFMSMAEPRDPAYAFECMLATAETLAKHLDADLLDGEHSALRPQTREHYKERIQQYQLKARSKSRNRAR